MLLQASAGTGKSFLLETVYIWCCVHGYSVEACAPTGIAAARLQVPRTPVRAYTLHTLFALNIEGESTLDPNKQGDAKTERLSRMTVLIVDECSMIDDGTWLAMKDQLTTFAAVRVGESHSTGGRPECDDFGRVHLLLAVDYKQLPPATSRPPFIAADIAVIEQFRFRVLRQNRRIATSEDAEQQQGFEDFHAVLESIAMNQTTDDVRQFFIGAYVRGAGITQKDVPFEENTAVFPMRRYRDRWNRQILKRCADTYKRSAKITAAFAPRGTRGEWIRDSAAARLSVQCCRRH